MGQLIGTKDFGVIEIERSWMIAGKQDPDTREMIQQGGHIALLVNGAYCHMSGLPFESMEEVEQLFTSHDRAGTPFILPEYVGLLEQIRDWFVHRHDRDRERIPKIMFDDNGWPELEDGTPVLKEETLYACLKPGPVLTAAIVGLSDRRRAEAEQANVKPEAIAPAPAPSIAGQPPAQPLDKLAPAAAKMRQEEALAKGRATAAANRAAKGSKDGKSNKSGKAPAKQAKAA